MNALLKAVEDWIAAGDIILLVLVIMVAEILLFGALRLRAGRGMPLGELIANSVAGGGLALAVRSALIDDAPLVVAAWLVVAAIGHTTFMVMRLRAPSV
ncbi:MAG TPA: hypothetical protein VLA56_02245 [Pseudomonadales bacterium]|nr:hypothetical protein [Pseudomonadales bacterium]